MPGAVAHGFKLRNVFPIASGHPAERTDDSSRMADALGEDERGDPDLTKPAKSTALGEGAARLARRGKSVAS